MDFYHATDPSNIESIISDGFRLPTYWDENDRRFYTVEGCLGVGVYISKDWQTALWFGRALLRVQLVSGTRILGVADEPDMKVINSLNREFGKELLSPDMTLHKIIPSNKHLKLNELIELTKYHYHRTWGQVATKKRKGFHGISLTQCWSMLRRYKYDGFGHATSDVGIMLLSPEKIEVKELIAVVRERPYTREKREFESLDGLKKYFLKHGEEKYKKIAEQIILADR